MQIDTGRLATAEELRKEFANAEDAHKAGWRQVPEHMTRQARRRLERNEPVDLAGHSPLAKFARAERRKRRKAQKAGRKAARRGRK